MLGFLTVFVMVQAGGTNDLEARWQAATDSAGACFVTRTVTIDAQPWTVQIQPSPTSASYDLFVAASKEQMRAIGPGGPPIRIALDAQPPFETFGWTQDTADGRRLLRSSLSREWVNAAGGSGTMTITASRLKLAVPAAGLAMAVVTLKSCHSKRLRDLNLDPVTWFEGRLAKINNPGRFFGEDDFPEGAPSGRVSTLLTFDPTGRPTRCVALSSTNTKLATGTCAIAMSKMTATMPTGPDGRPVASYAFFDTVWKR